MKHLGSGHQYSPVMEDSTYMVAIDTGNGQQDADNDDGVISFSFPRSLSIISKKPLVHGSHLKITLLKLSETARKLQKTDK